MHWWRRRVGGRRLKRLSTRSKAGLLLRDVEGTGGGDGEDIGHRRALRGSGDEREGDTTKGELWAAMAGMILGHEFR